MLGTMEERRWDNPFSRAGCNLYCCAEAINDAATMARSGL
jgi:hypothetical protein